MSARKWLALGMKWSSPGRKDKSTGGEPTARARESGKSVYVHTIYFIQFIFTSSRPPLRARNVLAGEIHK